MKLTKRIELLLKHYALGKGKGLKVNAKDGDGDGLVQDGTAFERKAPAKKAKKK